MTSPRRTFRTKTRAERRAANASAVVGAERAAHRESAMRQLVRKHGGRCALCDEPVSFKPGTPRYATIDHVRPLSRGGLDAPSNWQLACHECNQRKGNAWDERGRAP